jgi:hypothetical protein
MSLKKMPFISSVQLIRIDGSTVIPTTLYYHDKKPLAGKQALKSEGSTLTGELRKSYYFQFLIKK